MAVTAINSSIKTLIDMRANNGTMAYK